MNYPTHWEVNAIGLVLRQGASKNGNLWIKLRNDRFVKNWLTMLRQRALEVIGNLESKITETINCKEKDIDFIAKSTSEDILEHLSIVDKFSILRRDVTT